MSRKPIPIIIDTDPGVDDSFCLAFAVAHPELVKLKGVTTIGGNNDTSVTTRNALALLHLYGADDIPVAAGEDAYFTRPFGEPAWQFHGHNGLAEQVIPDSPKAAEPEKACDFIYKVAKECDGELVLVTVGPETNLAVAFEKYPDLKDMIKKIVVMGGSLTRGNVTPYAEANIWHDVPAADVVFKTGIPIDMIGLNVTLQCAVSEEVMETEITARPEVKDFMKALVHFRNGEAMHDAVALATMFDDGLMEWKCGHITIETEDEERYGQSVVVENETGNMRAAKEVHFERYQKIFLETGNYFA